MIYNLFDGTIGILSENRKS